MVRPIDLSSLPLVRPELGIVEHGGQQTILTAAARTDAFVPPDGGAAVDRLPGLRLAPPAGPWGLALRVQPDFVAAFDAGALVLRCDDGAWAKLAFERSPDGRPMAVSVVTRGTSDDANGPAFADRALYLRAVFTGKAHAFHTSTDGRRWELLRFFGLPGAVTAIDIIAQSPMGDGCRVVLDQAHWITSVPGDLRDGS